MLIYGRNIAREFLEKNNPINKIYLLKDFSDRNIINLIQKHKINHVFMDKNGLSKLADGNHQGIILDVPTKKMGSLEDVLGNHPDIIVALDHLEDPHNIGAIIRTCEAAGVKDILLPKDRSASTEGVVYKTSAGAIDNVNLIQVTNLREALNKLKKKGYWVVATSMDAKDNYNAFDYPEKIVIVIGNEAKGVSNILLKESDFLIKIPMQGTTNSLNASVAAGIIIFAAVSKRK